MEMLSLYDYLSKPAGKILGGLVCREAVNTGEPIQERAISNSKYEGNVHLYRKEFLDKYFKNK